MGWEQADGLGESSALGQIHGRGAMIGRMDENAQDPQKAALEAASADVAKRIPDATPPPPTGLHDVAELEEAVLRNATEAQSRSIEERKS
jgi:hypothetical protein